MTDLQEKALIQLFEAAVATLSPVELLAMTLNAYDDYRKVEDRLAA